MQPVGRCDRLGSGVLEKLQLMVEVLDGTDALTFAEPSPHARRQDRHPQHRYEYQQDHNRHSPTTYLRSRLKSLLSRLFPNWWMVGKCTAPTSSALLRLASICTNVVTPNQARRCGPAHARWVTQEGATPPPPVVAAHRDRHVEAGRHVLRRDHVAQGPAAMRDPARTRPPWVNPGGISSQWWVTRTSGGLAASARQRAEPHEQALAGAQVEAGEGLVEQEELGIAHQRPGQQDLLALALGDHPEGPVRDVADAALGEQPVRLLPVVGRVGVPPRLERAVPAAGHDVAGRDVRAQLPGHRAADQRRPAAAASARRPGPAARPAPRPTPAVGQSRAAGDT